MGITQSNENIVNAKYKVHKGELFDINNLVKIAATGDSYGANSTVNYYSFFIPGITKQSSQLFPVISMKADDFMLIELTMPDKETLSRYNLLNYTPYFFTYTSLIDGVETTTDVFASVDKTITFFDKDQIKEGAVNKICCTSSSSIALMYKKQGYIISMIPSEYLDSATFLNCIRIGILKGSTFDLKLNENFKITYHESLCSTPQLGKYFNAKSVILTNKPDLQMLVTKKSKKILAKFKDVVSKFKGLGYTQIEMYPYLSNFNDTKYPIISFYDAISVTPPAQIQGNNTCENYYNTNRVDLTDYSSTDYIYIIGMNQQFLGTCLIANIQIYDAVTNDNIANNGTINLTADIPSFTTPNYPFVSDSNVKTYPIINIKKLSISEIISSGTTSITIVERISYNPVNFNRTSYLYIDSCQIFIGSNIEL